MIDKCLQMRAIKGGLSWDQEARKSMEEGTSEG